MRSRELQPRTFLPNPSTESRRLATRLAALLLAVALLGLHGCAGSGGTDSNSLESLPRERTAGELELVATLETVEPGGLAVTHGGRIFVAVPRYDPDIPHTLAEVVDGEARPYPDSSLNERDEQRASRQFLSVEGLTIGPTGDLWVVDSGRPNFTRLVDGGAKLVRIDLESDEIVRRYVLSEPAVRDRSLLAGVRIDMSRRDEGVAYLTDASPGGFNGLVVVDLASGDAWRRLDLHPSTRADSEFIGIVEGRRFLFDPADSPTSPLSLGANGIALTPGAERLFFRPLAGRELYSIRTDVLVDPDVSPIRVDSELRRYGDQGFASDGLVGTRSGALFLTNYEDNAIVRRGQNGSYRTVVHDPRLLWPDSLAIADGWLYIATNQTHREPVFNDGEDRVEPPFAIFRTKIDAAPIRPTD